MNQILINKEDKKIIIPEYSDITYLELLEAFRTFNIEFEKPNLFNNTNNIEVKYEIVKTKKLH